jgi:hypothetical protein
VTFKPLVLAMALSIATNLPSWAQEVEWVILEDDTGRWAISDDRRCLDAVNLGIVCQVFRAGNKFSEQGLTGPKLHIWS